MGLFLDVINNYLNSASNVHRLDSGRVDLLYDHYQYFSEFLGVDISVSKEEFGELLGDIYERIGHKLGNEDQFGFIVDRVTRVFVDEAKDGHDIDIKWMIDHLWYFVTIARNYMDTSKYENLIPSIQNELYKKYEIKEDGKTKVKRQLNVIFQIKSNYNGEYGSNYRMK